MEEDIEVVIPWMEYCGYIEAVDTWQLRNVVDTYTCSREHKLHLLNAKQEVGKHIERKS